MKSTDLRNTADESVKIYIPGSFSAAGSLSQEKPSQEKEEVKIYSRSDKS